MVASRWPQRLDFLAAAIKRSISAVVRYSRVRTEEFTVVGGDRPPPRFSTVFWPYFEPTRELSALPSLVSIGAVGIHGQPWPEVSRPVRLQRTGQLKSPEPPARGRPRRPCHWHRCRSFRPDRWSG